MKIAFNLRMNMRWWYSENSYFFVQIRYILKRLVFELECVEEELKKTGVWGYFCFALYDVAMRYSSNL